MSLVESLDMSPRGSGRVARQLEVEFVRELGEADIALLSVERGIAARPILKLRDRHHALARCLANGMTDAQAAAVTGYDPSRVSVLKADTSFAKLLADYREEQEQHFADFTHRAGTLSLTAMNELQERLEDAPEEVSIPALIEVAKFAADRTGHAPIAKQMNMNVNVDLGDKLQAARQRLALTTAAEKAPAAFSLIDGGVND